MDRPLKMLRLAMFMTCVHHHEVAVHAYIASTAINQVT
jgi:hypothetical protein